MCSSKLIFWFEEIGGEHSGLVGKKCANLGAMTHMGMPVPYGFAISLDAYKKFLEATGVVKEIASYVSSLGELKDAGIAVFEEISQNIRAMIENQPIPKDLKTEVASYYERLSDKVGIPEVPVSVRSAGTESRPGMFETYLNVQGREEVLDKVKRVWASAFTPRAIAFRINKGMPIDGDMLGVGVVQMVNAKAAGIGFTVDPVSGDLSKIIVEANWGLGEGVVSGAETVDRFVVDKQSLEIIERTVGQKSRRVVSKGRGAEWEEVPSDMCQVSCVNDEEIKEIAKLARLLEDRLGQPQDVEWAIHPSLPFQHNIFLLQTRPAKVAMVKPQSVSEQLADRIVSCFREIDLSPAKDRIKRIQIKF